MGIFNLKDNANDNVEFVSAYSKLVKETYIQSVDELLIFDEVDNLTENKVFLFHKNDDNKIDAVLTGIIIDNAGYIGYILVDKKSNKETITAELIDYAEVEFKRKIEGFGKSFIGIFNELLSSYEDDDYVCPNTPKQVLDNNLLMINNGFYPINVEYCEPSMEDGVLDQYMYLAFKKANDHVTMKNSDLFYYIELIFSNVYELNKEILKNYIKYVKDESELRDDFFAEYYQIVGIPSYKLYELGENPY
jgi:hypothetical protein